MVLWRWQGNGNTGWNKVACTFSKCSSPLYTDPSFSPWTDSRNNVVTVRVSHWILAHQADVSKQLPSVSANAVRNSQPQPPVVHLSDIFLKDPKPPCDQLQGQNHHAWTLTFLENSSYLLLDGQGLLRFPFLKLPHVFWIKTTWV